MSDQQSLTVFLLLGSAIVGFLIGLRFGVIVIAFVAPIIGGAAAITLRHFHFLPAVTITFASLLVNQLTYLIGAWLPSRSITRSITK